MRGARFLADKSHSRQQRYRRPAPTQPTQSSQPASSRGSVEQSSATSGSRVQDKRGCFACGKQGHIAIYCPQRTSQTSSQQRVAPIDLTVGDSSKTHRVFATVDNRQAEHATTVVDTSGVIGGIPCSILFDLGASDSFITPYLVERCGFAMTKQDNRW